MDHNQKLGLVIEKLCIPGSQWRLGVEGKSNHLKSADLVPLAKGWLDFIRRSIMPTSNRSECTLDRDVMIYSIIQGEVVEVEDIISEKIYKIASNPYKKHLIYHLCEAAGIRMENDIPISVEKPITKKRMETHREQHRARMEEQVEEEAQQDQPPPQEQKHNPPQEYWQHLTTSIEQMRVANDSRWQQHTAYVEEMRAVQDSRWAHLCTTLDEMRAA
ncbi:hypothetical protein AHAS_Ahas10G0058200 [Arachis hypogaea]